MIFPQLLQATRTLSSANALFEVFDLGEQFFIPSGLAP